MGLQNEEGATVFRGPRQPRRVQVDALSPKQSPRQPLPPLPPMTLPRGTIVSRYRLLYSPSPPGARAPWTGRGKPTSNSAHDEARVPRRCPRAGRPQCPRLRHVRRGAALLLRSVPRGRHGAPLLPQGFIQPEGGRNGQKMSRLFVRTPPSPVVLSLAPKSRAPVTRGQWSANTPPADFRNHMSLEDFEGGCWESGWGMALCCQPRAQVRSLPGDSRGGSGAAGANSCGGGSSPTSITAPSLPPLGRGLRERGCRRRRRG